ncbi:MAG: type IV toxin-antitoxin system AbiEi family antitoxin [Candidatus Bathyarchaeota archaeon]
MLVDGLLEDYYLGYCTALNHWHMTEQIPRTAFIAITTRRRDFVYDGVVPIHFITIKPYKYFGWTTGEIGRHRLRVSDPEKTVIDSFDLPQYAGGVVEAAKALSYDLDWFKIIEYSNRQGNRTVLKRLGYLIELLEIDVSDDVLKQLRSGISRGYSWLDPTAPHEVLKHNSSWNLKINIPSEILRGI